MLTFVITTYNEFGLTEDYTWEFTPVDREPGFDIIKSDKSRATGSGATRPFLIKEVWQLTIGAGTLAFSDNRLNFLRLITAVKVVWKRKLGSKTTLTEFELETDRRLMFEYLQERRSLKRKTITLVEKEPNYYDSFAEFYERYLSLIDSNALW
jgi:hypothetical protein